MSPAVIKIDMARGVAMPIGTYDVSSRAVQACYGLFANASGDKSTPLHADWYHDQSGISVALFSRGDRVLGCAAIARLR